jgi:2-methylisocitrate lyase-like PEP mutase family enzyme
MSQSIVPLIGVYDVFSASIAARNFPGLFISGFGFAASFYGLPDIGFIGWPDIVAFVQRVRAIIPTHHLVVDIDDGYVDREVACHVVAHLESLGASAVVLEDQERPRRCGHLDGKRVMELGAFLEKLKDVLRARREMLVVARTDATDPTEALSRAKAFAEAGADAVLVEAVKDLSILRTLSKAIDRPLMFNQIAGGKSPPATLAELREAGASLVNYSTPCLFAAQGAMEDAMKSLAAAGGKLPAGRVDLRACNAVLDENLAWRKKR